MGDTGTFLDIRKYYIVSVFNDESEHVRNNKNRTYVMTFEQLARRRERVSLIHQYFITSNTLFH